MEFLKRSVKYQYQWLDPVCLFIMLACGPVHSVHPDGHISRQWCSNSEHSKPVGTIREAIICESFGMSGIYS